MQLNLFDDGNIAKNSFRERLKSFSLQEALADLEVIRKTPDAPADIETHIDLLDRLMKELPDNTAEALIFLGNFYIDFEHQPLVEILADDARFLKEGLARAMGERMNETQFDFIVPGLHPAEIFFAVKDFAAAERAAASFLKQKEENAFVRQLQACALYSMGEETSALTAYTFAFFNDPRVCRAQYIWPAAYHHKYDYLLRKYEQEESALIRLPFVLWQSGLTYIDTEALPFERLLQQSLREHEKEAQRTAEENILQFNRLLYLAESERLRLGRQNTSDKLAELQQTMQELNDEMFAVYINILKSFRNL